MNTYQIDLAGKTTTVEEARLSEALLNYCESGQRGLVVDELEHITKESLRVRVYDAAGRVLPLYVTLLQPHEVRAILNGERRTHGQRVNGREILTDGFTIWVNCEDTGQALGRFSRLGIDVHKAVADQVQGKSTCLACTSKTPELEDWRTFRELMQNHHGAEVPQSYLPRWLLR